MPVAMALASTSTSGAVSKSPVMPKRQLPVVREDRGTDPDAVADWHERAVLEHLPAEAVQRELRPGHVGRHGVDRSLRQPVLAGVSRAA